VSDGFGMKMVYAEVEFWP